MEQEKQNDHSTKALPLPRANPQPISIGIEQRDDVCLLRCQGPFRTGDHGDYLNAKMDEIRALHCPMLLADFEDVPSVGSSGLSFIVGLYRTSEGRLVLVRTQRWVRKALDITRLSAIIPMAPDIESGLALLRSVMQGTHCLSIPASAPS